MSALLENRVRQLEAQLSALAGEREHAPQRMAGPLTPKAGRFLAELQSQLNPGGTVNAKLKVISEGELTDPSPEVEIEIKDFTLKEGQSIPAQTKVWVYWYRTVWTWDSVYPDAQQGVRFRLTGDLYNGVGPAVLRLPQGQGYVDGDQIQVIDFYKVSLGLRGMFQASDQMEGMAISRGTTASGGIPQYDIIWMEQYSRAVEFTTTEYMGETNANEAWSDMSAEWMQGLQAGASFIHDDQQRFPDVISGAKGVALRDEYKDADNPDTPFYNIVACQRVIILAEATLVADLEPDDNLAEITDWTPVEAGEFTLDPGENNVDIANGRDLRGFSGDRILCYRSGNNKIGGKWVFGVLHVDRIDRIYFGKTAAAINKNAQGNVTRYNGSTLAATATVDTVRNRCANVAINKFVYYADIDGAKHMISAECPMT